MAEEPHLMKYLEDELKEVKGQLARLQQQLHQLQLALREQSERSREALATADQAKAAMAVLPKWDEEMRGIKETLERLQLFSHDMKYRWEEQERRLREDRERELQERAALSAKLSDLEKEIAETAGRSRLVEEQAKQHLEALQGLHRELEELRRRDTALDAQHRLLADRLRHAEELYDQFRGELEALGKQDDALLNRLLSVQDQARRAEEQSVQAIQRHTAYQEFAERIEQLRAERQRWERELALAKEEFGRMEGRVEDLERGIRQVESRLTQQAQHIAQAREMLEAQQAEVDQRLLELLQLLERQRVRAISQLEQEGRELKQLVPRAP